MAAIMRWRNGVIVRSSANDPERAAGSVDDAREDGQKTVRVGRVPCTLLTIPSPFQNECISPAKRISSTTFRFLSGENP
jgi:hypothetical protein